MTGLDAQEEHPRPQYLARLAHIKKKSVNIITNTEEPKVPFWKMRVPATILSFSVVLLLVCSFEIRNRVEIKSSPFIRCFLITFYVIDRSKIRTDFLLQLQSLKYSHKTYTNILGTLRIQQLLFEIIKSSQYAPREKLQHRRQNPAIFENYSPAKRRFDGHK